MKYAFKLFPFALVILLCLISRPAVKVGLSKSDSQASPQSVDGVWTDVTKQTPSVLNNAQTGPRTYRSFTLNRTKLSSLLAAAPLEAKPDAAPVRLSLPFADGTFSEFQVVESPIMEPALAARFPEIRTFSAQGIDDPTATSRFDWTPEGFHALIISSRGAVLIEPNRQGTQEDYLVYFQGDVPVNGFDCEVSEAEQENAIAAAGKGLNSTILRPAVSSDSNLRTYRLAVAATGDYTQTYGGGTVNGALSAITTTVNAVNAIYQREVGVNLVLVANETAIIFTDTNTDDYTSDNTASLLTQNQTKLDAVIGTANYDVGHVFDGRTEAPGFFSFQGQASIASTCREGFKARGASITRSLSPSSLVAAYNFAHELGHQFGATHTFNATTGSCSTQRSASTAYEPGTGSTIMGYRFTCGAEDLMSSDIYFHNASLEQIVNFTTIGGASMCPTLTATGNAAPVVNAGPSYTIPQGTPFSLTAIGSDPNGDDLTYDWEEFDLGNPAPPSTDDGSRPIFRSFTHTPNPSRSFPRLSDILSANATFGESLPTTTRTMNFRVTVRDNRANGGGIGSAATQVNVRADSGPFVVTQPNAASNWLIGSTQTITWNVANTNLAPVNCANVRILMSINGGLSFPYVLAEDTPNDGSETLTLPVAAPTSSGISPRIKVVGKGNIFFNISPAFTLTLPANSMQFSSSAYSGSEADNPKQIVVTVTRTGNTAGSASAEYDTFDNSSGSPCTTLNTNRASSRCDYITAAGFITFAPGESSKTINIPIVDDSYPDGTELFNMELRNIVGASFGSPTQTTITLFDNDAAVGPNQIDEARYFVRQHYIDFLNREPDAAGLDFWSNEILQCGGDAGCVDIKRINVSAAFYQSIEFQETGYLVYRLYKAANGDITGLSSIGGQHSLPVPSVRFNEFVADSRRIGEGIVVGQPGWPEALETNKKKFIEEFLQRIRFAALTGLAPAKFVDTLNANAGNPLSAGERDQLVADLSFGIKTQAQVLRAVAEDPDLVNAEKNRAFVLMQYFGYLRRNPNDNPDSDHSGYDFWLRKLNDFGGNFVNAEMVRSFIISIEYRQRFAP